ncbi:MAG TPA: hypothetical protein VN429_10495 [Methanospirillum sp.]|uniref:hypothetical protein n=1 Tax=Methanospirillum sp. TaxID=45200 RepID=UPI002BC1F7AF|nr:hypothetical protein [Methanospirillum sp.]HWQ64834.1 hypothetical protein [Methanospirillum sp.]
MIEISVNARRPASRVDRFSPVELEALALIQLRCNGRNFITIGDLDSFALADPEHYPILTSLDIRPRRWQLGHVLKQIGATKTNQKSKCWRMPGSVGSIHESP